jgi:hypothetical protein
MRSEHSAGSWQVKVFTDIDFFKRQLPKGIIGRGISLRLTKINYQRGCIEGQHKSFQVGGRSPLDTPAENTA